MKLKINIYTFLSLLILVSEIFAQTYNVPEILYYKFNNGTTTTPNYALPGQGTNPAVLVNMQMGPGGQFDSTLLGNGGTGTTTHVNSGWNMNLGASNWTISLWINNFPAVTGTSYLFGNDITTSFRCFTNGAAGAGNITLRGTGITNIDVAGVLPGPSVIHFVYDSSVPAVRTFVNGVFRNSTGQAAFNFNAAVPFKVGSYGTASSIPVGAMIDEFRFYNRALDSTEIGATWNRTLPAVMTGTNNNILFIPESFSLAQNHPNPFNPTTTIKYTIPVESFVTIKLYDVLGMEISTLINESKFPGEHKYEFNAVNLTSGVYFYKLEAGDYNETKRMILLK